MKHHRLFGPCAALVSCMALLVANAPVWAVPPGTYFEASGGFTRPAKAQSEEGVTFDPGTDLALGIAYGTFLSENTRMEAELAYAKVAMSAEVAMGGFEYDADVTGDGFHLGANFLYDFGAGSSPAKFEIGFGLGWVFYGEACAEFDGARICVDADDDDWNVQGIVGGSYALSDTGALVVRYRMWNSGGFSSEDRIHVFTVGYRHQF